MPKRDVYRTAEYASPSPSERAPRYGVMRRGVWCGITTAAFLPPILWAFYYASSWMLHWTQAPAPPSVVFAIEEIGSLMGRLLLLSTSVVVAYLMLGARSAAKWALLHKRGAALLATGDVASAAQILDKLCNRSGWMPQHKVGFVFDRATAFMRGAHDVGEPLEALAVRQAKLG